MAAAPEPSGIDLFVELLRYQGRNPDLIRSGYAEFDMRQSGGGPSATEIEEHVSRTVGALRESLKTEQDPGKRASIEDAIETIPPSIRSTMKSWDKRRIRYRVLFDGNSRNGKSRVSSEVYDFTLEEWEKPTVVVREDATLADGNNVMFDSASKQAVVTNTNYMVIRFQDFGRMAGPQAQAFTAMLLRDSDSEEFVFSDEAVDRFRATMAELERMGSGQAFVVAEKRDFEGSLVYVLENRLPNDTVVQRTWVDVARGYLCPLMEYYTPKGVLTRKARSSEYFLHEPSGLYFPRLHQEQEFDAVTGDLVKTLDYEFDTSSFRLNHLVSPDEFSVDLPAGTGVLDERNPDRERSYQASKPVVLSFARGELDPETTDGLTSVVVSDSPPTGRPTSRVARLVWAVLSMLGILLLVAFWMRRRAKRASPHCLLGPLILATLACLAGCSSEVETGGLRVEPREIQCGNLLSSDWTHTEVVKIFNDASSPVIVEQLVPSCRCMVADVTEKTISPHSFIELPVTIKLNGRTGRFRERIAVKVGGTDEPIVVSVSGTVTTDYWLPQRTLRLTIPDGHAVAQAYFDVRTVKWPDLAFDTDALDESLSMRLVDKYRDGEQTVLRFELEVALPVNEHRAMLPLNLRPMSPKLPPEVLRIHCFREGWAQNVAGHSSSSPLPRQLALGIVRPAETKVVHIYGDYEFLRGLELCEPQNTADQNEGVAAVSLGATDDSQGRRGLILEVGTDAADGMLHETISVQATGGIRHEILIVGYIRAPSPTNVSGAM
ncbi:MAG: DUF1573 domain-containing protein [Planctomycetes bacterium]|nr:DUF1573 domain-containing protein [Planctomycetota bacterium]